jgi:ribosomal protein L31
MEAIGSFIDEKIKSEVTYKDHPYYGGQVYEAEKELRSALLSLLDNRDFE